MFVKTFTSALNGIDTRTVTVEAHVSAGVGMSLVGLPDNAVRESQERIRSAFISSGHNMTGKRLVVNLAPADIRKEGSAYDLPIAISILAATGQVPDVRLGEYMIFGELSLDGALNPVRGALPMAINARQEGFKGVIIPYANSREAAVVEGLEVIGVKCLSEAVEFLSGHFVAEAQETSGPAVAEHRGEYEEGFEDVQGQIYVKRALEIAVAGGHNVLMIGSPGSGKTMLARLMPTIMPDMTDQEALESTKIHSVAGKLGASSGLLTRRPFRAPHHITTQVALIGGGTSPMPGEISLAHNGILFLDEVAEFGHSTLEVLRQPLEDKEITISRAKYTVRYPANFILVASMNPCPCGYKNHPAKECLCSAGDIARYRNKLSGPLLDRIDMHVEVSPVSFGEIHHGAANETSSTVKSRVETARGVQRRRFAEVSGIHTNSMMNSRMVKEMCGVSEASRKMLEKAFDRLHMSARSYVRVLKLARTIADLDSSDEIEPKHVAEAIGYRSLDRDTAV